jgi:hypothetical protein
VKPDRLQNYKSAGLCDPISKLGGALRRRRFHLQAHKTTSKYLIPVGFGFETGFLCQPAGAASKVSKSIQ